MTPAQRRGLRYEDEVLASLAAAAEAAHIPFVPHPWLRFQGRKLCPDAILLWPPALSLLLVEIKYRHCAEAYHQLRGLYGPALGAALPSWRVVPLIICRWHSAHEPLPERYRLEASPISLLRDPSRAKGAVSVHICSSPKSLSL